jgi:hypothetical protein
MKKYVEPDCNYTVLNMGNIVCGSFDSVNNTEMFNIEDEELI